MATKNVDELELEKNTPEQEIEDFGFMSGKEHSKYAKVYFAKCYTKKGETPYFKLQKVVDSKFTDVITKEPVKGLQGNLTKIKPGVYIRKEDNVEQKKLTLTIEYQKEPDEVWMFSWNCGWNSTLINLVNCLLGCDTQIKSFNFQLYNDGKSEYAKSSVMINGKRAEWKYQPSDLEKYKEKVFNKKGDLIKTEIGDLIEFLESELVKHLPIILPNYHPENDVVKEKVETTIVEKDIDKFFEEDPDMELGVDEPTPPTTKKKK